MTAPAVPMPPVTRPLERSDGEELLRINRACPIVADFTFVFDRSPDFFAWPERAFDGYRYVGLLHDGRLVGYCMLGLARGYIGAEPGAFCYGGDARVLPEARGLGLTRRAIEAIASEIPADVDIGFCLVKSGNAPAERIVTTQRHEGFELRPLCAFEATNILLVRRMTGPGSCRVRRATEEDVPALVEVMRRAFAGRLFAPVVTQESLERELARWPGFHTSSFYLGLRSGKPVGCLAVCDTDAVRRTTVLSYSRRGQLLRLGYRAARALAFPGMAPLPGRGEPFRALTLTHVAIPERDPAVLRDLLAAAVNDHLGRGLHMLHLGMAMQDPLLLATRRMPVQRFRSQISAIVRRTRELPVRVDPYIDLRMI